MDTTRRKQRRKSRFLTFMLVPESNQNIQRIVVPTLILKALLVVAFASLLLIVFGAIDYFRVQGRAAENKRLKGENFRLKEEIQLIRNKVDHMELSLERVRNYAQKLQILTGQKSAKPKAPRTSGKANPKRILPPNRAPRELSSETPKPVPAPNTKLPLKKPKLQPSSFLEKPRKEVKPISLRAIRSKIQGVSLMSLTLEPGLAALEEELLSKRALALATPSLMPIPGYVSSAFGYRIHPYDGRRRWHHGIDIVADPGTPVRAPASGRVIYSGSKWGYGKVVVLDHGYGIRTLFAHNSKLFVRVGMRVNRGQVLSLVGSTGRATGPHLHYEVRKHGRAVNPAPFFQSNY